MSPTRILRTSVAATLAFVAACGGEPASDAEPPTPGPTSSLESTASVTIVEPGQGAEIAGDSVMVRLEAAGVRIVPAGDTTSGTGHHHLYLDEDLGEPDTMVPTVPGRVIHLGTGAAEYVFTDVPAGEHRLIAVVADGMHVPLQPWVTDTVVFVVR